MFNISPWLKLWLFLTFFRGFNCDFRLVFGSDQTYSSRIIEAGKNGIKVKSLSISPLNHQRKPIYIDTTVFNDETVEPKNCTSKDNEYCIQWNSVSRLHIVRTNQNCEKLEWSTKLQKSLTVVFDLEGLQLYGGSEVDNQSWPIQKKPYKSAYITQSDNSQAVLEPYWLDSKGQFVFVYDDTVPLFVEHDEKKLQLRASNQPPYTRKSKGTHLKFMVCNFENVKVAHQHAIKHIFKKPAQVPDFRTVQYPIWSTWATYKTNVSEQAVSEFARAITENGFPNSALEIDDMWETCYGSFVVDTKRFPDMKRFVQVLKKQGFRVTVWVHPFVNIDCSTFFKEGTDEKYFVRNDSGSVSTKWWNGPAGIVDFTNPKAAKWWSDRLKNLQEETGIDSFKFDAGESSWAPQIPVYHKMDDNHPDSIVKSYIEALRPFGNMVEVRTAKGTQDITPFVRMLDRETTWTGRLSLETLIPTLLQMSIVGYPFVLPDMIGGNAYKDNELNEELFIRWLQANVFMPALQFSLPPWKLGSKVVNITRKYIDLHAEYAPKIYELMQKASKDGTPVNLPMWWLDPNDAHLYDIDSQFMLGEDILVAPVLQKGATTRNIYLPKGSWRDENNPEHDLIKGPTTLNAYKADLEVLPYFTRVQKSDQ